MKILRKFRALVVNQRTDEIRLRNITGMTGSSWYKICERNNPWDDLCRTNNMFANDWFEAIEDNDPWSPTWNFAIWKNNPHAHGRTSTANMFAL